MSADNWAKCPRCLAIANARQQQLRDKATKSYGKVPRDEYEELCRKADAPVEVGSTFREDYSICLDEDGEFYVSYRGMCKQCGLTHSFKHTEKLDLSKKKE